MKFKKNFKSKKAQAVLEYLILSALFTSLVLFAFWHSATNPTPFNFFGRAKMVLTNFFNTANNRITCGFENPGNL